MVFSQQIRRFSQWLRSDMAAGSTSARAGASVSCPAVPHGAALSHVLTAPRSPAVCRGLAVSRYAARAEAPRKRSRSVFLEAMEPRLLMTADPIWVGGVYVEDDSGTDQHGDSFYITFKGGAPGTQLTRLVIDGDLNTPGFGVADLFFDTVEGGYGADHASPFKLISLTTANPAATVNVTVTDGSTKLILDLTNFQAGDTLVFQIDVDEAQSFDPNETDLEVLNSGFDPITSGVEFQNSLLKAEFRAPHYEDAAGQTKFLNRYDTQLEPSGLPLPEDNFEGKRDRSAGTAFNLQQIPKPISLGGIVYVDNNYNLTLDSGEARLANVELELFRNDNGNYVSTGFKTVTDSQGAYSFGTNLKLMPGIYQVRETQLSGYFSVGATKGVLTGGIPVGQTVVGNPDWLTQIEIPLGDQHATLLNFAEAQPASISGRVTVVRNGFDCDDANSIEEPIAGVTVELRDANNQVVATQLTDANGNYRFSNLRAGNYTVHEITPAGYLEGDAHVGTISTRVVGQRSGGSQISSIQILGGNQAIDYDFCELLPSDISGHVYADRNNNGVREPGEAPISGVTLILWNQAGTQIGQTVTDPSGFYRFDNLTPGTYRITELQPSGYLPGKAAAGTILAERVGSTDASGDVIAQIAVPSGVHGIDYDFGEILPGSIGGRVIVDTNGNCIIDAASDMPLKGVLVELLSSSGAVLQTTLTDANGYYRFDNLMPGEYRVHEVQPSGYFQGDHHAGSGGGNATTEDLISQIIVSPGDTLAGYDFCEIPPADISGHVFVDRDGDCVFDANEEPIATAKVTLYDASGEVVATTTTDANGHYEFRNLKPGVYTLREEQPAGYLQGGQKAGSGGGDDSLTDTISSIAIAAGKSLVDYDFCEIPPADISGHVFVDRDGDCLFDSDEAPIAGAKVTLYDAAGAAVATTSTDASGRYQFRNLKPGTYTLREEQPAGYFQGGQKAGSGGGNDSLTDTISAIAIGAGASLVDYDFCEVLPSSIAGQVFVDLDFDCMRDADEQLIAGVKIELRDASGNVIATTLTDANGQYKFLGLRPGTYSVTETQPDGYFQGGQVAPATGGDATLDDVISNISVRSGDAVKDANFCEVPPAKISGFVFQDGGPIVTSDISSLDLNSVRDGRRTSDDQAIGGVRLQLRTIAGSPIDSSRALSGVYTTEYIEVVTDSRGYFEFDGLRAGTYNIYQLQPIGYIDSIDTPGSTGGFGINKGQNQTSPQFELLMQSLTMDSATNPGFDGILLVSIDPNQHSFENNFSEVVTTDPPKPPLPPPPFDKPPPPPDKVIVSPDIWLAPPPMRWEPLAWSPAEPLIGVGHRAPPTWHLSVINGGYPRGRRSGQPVAETELAQQTELLDEQAWEVRGMKESRWTIVSTAHTKPATSRMGFDLPGAEPVVGDFNGDGFDELALFVEGEWFIDVNGNGVWDDEDIWMKLGDEGDQPVAGDWDGDGKDDTGIFGRTWIGDERALRAETGLPDPENMRRIKPKNVPPVPEDAPDRPRWLQPKKEAPARADLIDHVFRFGSEKDIAISGDFNGDGISSIGVFQGGKWSLDVDGDGLLSPEHDREVEFGQAGDLPLVGDFDGDGLDDMAIVRGNQVIVDTNANGRIDATDQVFLLEEEVGTVIAGDFDGDGKDEPAVYQSAAQRRTLEARR